MAPNRLAVQANSLVQSATGTRLKTMAQMLVFLESYSETTLVFQKMPRLKLYQTISKDGQRASFRKLKIHKIASAYDGATIIP